MAPPLLGGIQAVGHLDADLAGMGRHKGDHAPHHVQVLRHQRERRLQAVADIAGMVDDLGKVEQQPQLADRFTYALPMRRQHRRCGGSRPFLIRGGSIRRWRLLMSFHAQGSPFRLPADIPARLQLLEIGHLSFPGISATGNGRHNRIPKGPALQVMKEDTPEHTGKVSVPGMMRQYGQGPERYRPVASRGPETRH